MDISILLEKQKELMELVPHEISELNIRRLIAGKGLIEEVLEYLNSVGTKPWRPEPMPYGMQLEELADQLFFWLELVAMSTFHLNDIEEKYLAKHEENLHRYEMLARGDTSWDKRLEKREL